MATAPNSSLLFQNVKEILTTFIPAHSRRDSNQLYASIGVKSNGTITFPDNKSNRAEFIRVSPDAPVIHVKELLTRQWCNGRPSLVISVTGGAKEYNMKPKLLRAFRRGLLKVARTTGAWIITGGMNTGIMKLVGEIVQINPDRFRPIHLIGIATWGCVSGFQQLDVHGSNVHYAQSRSDIKGEAPLEPNHTEFIFVDDGTARKFGGEIDFRAKLEQAISSGFFASKPTSNPTSQFPSLQGTASLRPDNSEPVPVVLLVVEGGPNTVRTVHSAVVQNNIPAVILEGTGRCCDLFAKAWRLYNEHRETMELTDEASINVDQNILAKRYEELKHKLREELKDEFRTFNGDLLTPNAGKTPHKPLAATTNNKRVSEATDIPKREVDTTDYFELIYECIHTRRNFVNVISLNSRNPVEPDIDLVILQALLNATSGTDSGKPNIQRKREQLHLALEWNRVDIAKNYIMKDDRDWEKINLNDLFSLALDRNQLSFVKLFLDHDFSLTDLFRNHEKLLALYINHTKENHNLTKASTEPLRTIYKEILQPLIGDFFEVDAALPSTDVMPRDGLINKNEDELRCCCCVPRIYHSTPTTDRGESVRSDASTGHTGSLLDVDKELFLWSVITGKREFALLFWSRGKNKICAALVATSIYKKLARKDNDDSENPGAVEFEKLAVQILDKFYQTDPHTCTKAIIRQIPAYGNVTWLELAVEAGAKQFIAQKAVQDVLNDIWWGFIDQRTAASTIVFSTFMLWFSGFLRYHNELVKRNDETTPLDDSLNKTHPFQSQTSQDKRIINRSGDAIQMRFIRRESDVDNAPIEFIDYGCREKSRTRVYRYFGNITTFMRAPYVKYLYNLYFHGVFLLLFSYVMLCDLFPLYDFPVDVCAPTKEATEYSNHAHDDDNIPVTNRTSTGDKYNTLKSASYGFEKHARPSNTEIVLVVWVFTLLCEEIRQFFSIEAQTRKNAATAYFKIFWNKLDVLAIILFFVGFALRFLPSSECYCAARIVLSVDLTIWFMRSLDIFAAVKRLGPKLVMIGKMAQDMKFFMLMLTVFILAFGVSSYSLIFGIQKFSWHLPREIVNIGYWQIFGELNALDKFEHNYKANGYAAFILLVAYMAIVSILLVNLLIAMFSNTFNNLQNNTDRIWKFQRYLLVCEYLSRPALPPPFIFFSHLWRLTLFVSARCLKLSCMQKLYANHSSRTKYQISIDEKKASFIEIVEDALGDEVYYGHLKLDRKLLDENDLDEERVQTPQETMLNKMRILENRLQTVTTQQAHMFEYLECLMDGLKTMGGESIRIPDRRRFDHEESFDESNNNGDPTKRMSRRESSIDDYHYRSNSNADEHQSSIINFFRPRRNAPILPNTPMANDI